MLHGHSLIVGTFDIVDKFWRLDWVEDCLVRFVVLNHVDCNSTFLESESRCRSCKRSK